MSSANYRFLGSNDDVVNISGYLSRSGSAYNPKDSNYLKGMAKRSGSFDLGINADFNLSQGTITTYAQHDVSGTYKGYQAGLNYTHQMVLGTIAFVPFIRVSYMDKNYVDYYFGVKNNEVTTNRKAYSGTGDFAYDVAIPLSENWDVAQTTTYTRLGNKVSDSPIVDSANQWSASAIVSYHF